MKRKTIIICNENREQMQAMIDAAQRRSRVREIDVNDVFAAVDDVKKRLCLVPKKRWNGTTATVNPHAGHFPGSYNGTPMATYFCIEYRNKSWRLTDVYRAECDNEYMFCSFSEAALDEARIHVIRYMQKGLPSGFISQLM